MQSHSSKLKFMIAYKIHHHLSLHTVEFGTHCHSCRARSERERTSYYCSIGVLDVHKINNPALTEHMKQSHKPFSAIHPSTYNKGLNQESKMVQEPTIGGRRPSNRLKAVRSWSFVPMIVCHEEGRDASAPKRRKKGRSGLRESIFVSERV